MKPSKIDLARATGHCPAMITRWLQGKRRLSGQAMAIVAAMVDLPVERLSMPECRSMLEARLSQRRAKALTPAGYREYYRELKSNGVA